MTPQKRLFDIALALLLCVPLLPVMALIAALVALKDGRPVLYVSERMRSQGEGFRLVKFRTMKVVAADAGVSGSDKADRITRTGRFLRRTRLDELPQLWNVLAGDISFVGPRPPLRQYVERFPQVYRQVLASRPGITGLASLHLHDYEERVLSRARTAEETDALYCRLCIPRKARIDMIYQRHASLCFDLQILVQTGLKLFYRRRP
ncbi:sugar transferase [Aureimonas populi]|uniref:Sugar transferase n=1 Tax=Aureimonas populi TaxID=1701758 RepID=A0ABW5CHX6_9HYPH|nr:sugar transferase [Aureimonas populi]